MPTSLATARSVTASAEPVRSISASAPDTISSVSLAPWPRAFRCRLPAPGAAGAQAPALGSAVSSADFTSPTLHLLAHLSMLTTVKRSEEHTSELQSLRHLVC